mgnify:CR=1 FL=1
MLTDKNPAEEGDYNRALGVDANLSFLEGSTNLTGFVAQTWTPGSQGENRAGYLEFDRRAGDVELTASYLDVGNDFDPDDGLDLTSIVTLDQPSFGTLIVNANGTVDSLLTQTTSEAVPSACFSTPTR